MSPNRIVQRRTAEKRDSNIELLRIIAMLLVLVVHTNFRAYNAPLASDIINCPLPSFFRFLNESLSIICVNVFILITGWFGIRPRITRFIAFIFQVLFFGIIIYITLYILGKVDAWKMNDWIQLISFRRKLWFVNSYIVLYILAPVLNAFVKNTSRKEFKSLLIVFFIVQTIMGIANGEKFFCDGYSPLSFMGLYLLAQYVRKYPNKYTSFNKYSDIAVYLGASLCTTVLSIALVRFAGKNGWILYAYLSPLVIISSFYFFLFFTKISFYSKSVNWVASSAFSVYLLHCDPLIFEDYYIEPIINWYANDSTLMYLLHVFILITVVFIIAIIVDKIREFLWNRILFAFEVIRSKPA